MAFGIRTEFITKPNSICYIASKLESTYDDYGNEITQYAEPQKYFFDIQPLTGSSDMQAYGEKIDNMKVAYLPKIKYQNMFKEFDVAYLDGNEPLDESFNGDNANYRIYSVTPQNANIRVVFVKIVRGETI